MITCINLVTAVEWENEGREVDPTSYGLRCNRKPVASVSVHVRCRVSPWGNEFDLTEQPPDRIHSALVRIVLHRYCRIANAIRGSNTMMQLFKNFPCQQPIRSRADTRVLCPQTVRNRSRDQIITTNVRRRCTKRVEIRDELGATIDPNCAPVITNIDNRGDRSSR